MYNFRNNRDSYTELGRMQLEPTRSLVISQYSGGGFTMAQEITIPEGNRNTKMFLKGAIIFSDIDQLYHLRNTINLAIKSAEGTMRFDSFDDADNWDD